MPTVINNPGQGDGGSGMGSGLVIGIAIVILIGLVVFFVYGMPALRGGQQNPSDNINIQVPNPLDNQNGGGNGG